MAQLPKNLFSVSTALEGLTEAVEEVERLETALASARAVRNGFLVDAAEHMSITKLARMAKLSRAQVIKIASPRKRDV
jgi:hypothetical protein